MKILDKNTKARVEVRCAECLAYECYWPRPNPGSFVQGRGYQSYGDSRDREYSCGTRDIHGCPQTPKVKKGGKK